MTDCRSCGERNPARARFCLACGASLAEATDPPPAQPVRKTVTVLFCDVVGSTALGERLDPEILRSVLGRYHARMRAAVETHQGTVEKFIGDAIMAVFGTPRVREDDALRAVRAAADMRAAVRRLNEDLTGELGVRIEVRIGVNTGVVVTGGVAETLVTGDTVNVAARLEESARPDEILLSQPTYRLVRHAVTVELLAPLKVRGRAMAVPAVRLVSVLHPARGMRRFDAPLVGRDGELGLLRDAFSAAAAERECHLVTVLGQAGVGKSRLLAETIAGLRDRAKVVVGRCLAYGQGSMRLLEELFCQLTGLSGDEPRERVRARLLELLADDDQADGVAELLGGTLDGQAPAPDVLPWAIRRLLEGVARRRPVLVVIDDLHWAGATMLGLVEDVVARAQGAPALIVCLARPDLLDRRPTWAAGLPRARSVTLEPLPTGDCGRLIDDLLGGRAPEPVWRRICDVAEGNPLFVEELVAMLVDEGMLRRGSGGAWVSTGNLARLRIPPTVEALLASRLERLAATERAVLERGAIAGKVFYADAVADLSQPAVRDQVPVALLGVVRDGLVQPAPSDFAGQEAYRFRHVLFRDAAYDSLPKQLRAELHQRFADWVERAADARGTDVEEIAGYHLEASHRLRQELGLPGDPAVAARAAARLGHAGRRAAARGDYVAAENLLTRTLALLPPDGPDRAGLMVELGEVLTDLAEFARAEVVLGEALMAGSDLVLAAQVSIARTYLRLAVDSEGVSDQALTAATDAIAVFRERGHELGLAKAWVLISEVHLMRCRMESRYEAMEQARVHARGCGDEALEARCVSGMLGSLAQGPASAEEVLAFGEEALAWARARGRRSMEAAALAHMARAHAHQGRLDQARVMVDRARWIWEDLGLAVQAASSSQVASLIELLAGDLAAAEAQLRHAMGLLEQLGERNYAVTAAAQLARVRLAQGDEQEAERLAEHARGAGASDDIMVQVLWRDVLGRLAAARHDPPAAERLCLEAVDLAEATDFPDLRDLALLDLAEVLQAAGDAAGAAGALTRALRIHEAKGNVLGAKETRRRLAEVAGTESAKPVP